MHYLKKTPPDFIALKKLLKSDFSGFPEIRIALLGDSATQFVAQALRGFGYLEKFNFSIFEADFNQIDLNVFNHESDLYRHNPDYVIILKAVQKLRDRFYQTGLKERINFAETIISEYDQMYDEIVSRQKCQLMVSDFMLVTDDVYGGFSSKQENSFGYQLKKINYLLSELALKKADLQIVEISQLMTQNSFCAMDIVQFYSAELAFSLELIPYIVRKITAAISAIQGRICKCIITDLDNTLWGSVIGDDGIEKIQIGHLGSGRIFTDFQKWLREMKNRGIMLAVSSKNEETVARGAFAHPDMVLGLDDFVVFMADWNRKSENIKKIQKILNIGFDSMMFIDDNPAEREEVRQAIPELSVPELPDDPAYFLDFISNLYFYGSPSFSTEDSDRTEMYRTEAKRKNLELTAGDSGTYLKSLEMRVCCELFEDFNIPRVVQLFQRTNQFNFRNVRYTEEEIRRIADSPEYYSVAVRLSDRFGDYGLVSAVVCKKNCDNLFIENWVMSCRVFGRGLENFIMNEICRNAVKAGFRTLSGEYIQSEKNGVIKDLFSGFDFKFTGRNWVMMVQDYVEKNHFIGC